MPPVIHHARPAIGPADSAAKISCKTGSICPKKGGLFS